MECELCCGCMQVFGDVYIMCCRRRMKEARNACGMLQKSSFLSSEERENKD